jgi:hypothetical protein
MSERAFIKLLRGLKDVQAYKEGERQGYRVTVLAAVDVEKSSQVVGD